MKGESLRAPMVHRPFSYLILQLFLTCLESYRGQNLKSHTVGLYHSDHKVLRVDLCQTLAAIGKGLADTRTYLTYQVGSCVRIKPSIDRVGLIRTD